LIGLAIAAKKKWLYAIFAIGGLGMFIMFGFLYYLSDVLEDRFGIDGIYEAIMALADIEGAIFLETIRDTV